MNLPSHELNIFSSCIYPYLAQLLGRHTAVDLAMAGQGAINTLAELHGGRYKIAIIIPI